MLTKCKIRFFLQLASQVNLALEFEEPRDDINKKQLLHFMIMIETNLFCSILFRPQTDRRV